MPAVFCLHVFGSGSELIEVSVLVELGFAEGVQSSVAPFGQVLRIT